MNKILDLYTDYLISQNAHATATGLSELTNHAVSHDKVTRFLNQENFSSKDLWKYVKKEVRKHAHDEGILSLDDSIEEKPHTDENDIVCWHYSHAKGQHVKGMNILSCLVDYGNISLPIDYQVIKKDKQYFCTKENKQKRCASITKNEHFRVMIKQAHNIHIKFKYVLADNWFGSKENLTYINNLGKKFIIGIKSNRTIALSLQDIKNHHLTPVKQLDMKDNDTIIGYLKGVPFPVKLIKKVFTNESGSTGVLYLVSNDLDEDVDSLYKTYQKRWNIEVYHKSIKQNASLAKSPTKTVRSQSNHIFASLIGFVKLQTLKIKQVTNHFAIKHQLILKANQAAMQELIRLRKLYGI